MMPARIANMHMVAPGQARQLCSRLPAAACGQCAGAAWLRMCSIVWCPWCTVQPGWQLASAVFLAYTACMGYRLLADLVLVLHLAFVFFALFGGLLVWRKPRLWVWHLAALAWGLVVQWANWICPLTPLENHFRQLSGQAGYTGSFIEQVIVRVLYPDLLTPALRYWLGLVLLAVNLAVYLFVYRQWKRHALQVNQRA